MISVVIATYCGEKFIERQIRSILNQSVPVDQIVISDDCSNDQTIRIVNDVLRGVTNIDVCICENEKNLGYIGNFFHGISKASGDFIFLSDQDDIWESNKVERMIQEMKNNDIEVLCSNFSIINENDESLVGAFIIPEFVKKAHQGLNEIRFLPLLFGNVAQGCTYCFTKRIRDIYLQAQCFDVIHDFQIMLIGAALGKAYFLNEKLIKYRIHGKNSVGFAQKKSLKHISLIPTLKRPKVAVFLQSVRRNVFFTGYKRSLIVLFLRLPVIKAMVKRFL